MTGAQVENLMWGCVSSILPPLFLVTAQVYAFRMQMSRDKNTNLSGSREIGDSDAHAAVSTPEKMHAVRLLGVRLDCVDDAYILARMREALEGGDPVTMTYAHFDTLLLAESDDNLRQSLEQCDIVAPEGIAVHMMLRLFSNIRYPRFSNPDFNIAAISLAAMHGSRILCIGGTSDVVSRMPTALEAMGFPATHAYAIDGWTTRTPDEWMGIVSGARPDMIVLGMGGARQNTMQQFVMISSTARVVFAVGACFDLLTGMTVRPPRWMWKFGLEWTARLVQEPRRLWRRYILRLPRFLMLILREQLRTR